MYYCSMVSIYFNIILNVKRSFSRAKIFFCTAVRSIYRYHLENTRKRTVVFSAMRYPTCRHSHINKPKANKQHPIVCHFFKIPTKNNCVPIRIVFEQKNGAARQQLRMWLFLFDWLPQVSFSIHKTWNTAAEFRSATKPRDQWIFLLGSMNFFADSSVPVNIV